MYSAIMVFTEELEILTQIPRDERYQMAEEYLTATYKLWEGSWRDDVVEKMLTPANIPFQDVLDMLITTGEHPVSENESSMR